MKEVIEKIQELHTILDHKVKQADVRESNLADREAELKYQEEAFAVRYKEMQDRENACIPSETVLKIQAENQKRTNELNDAAVQLEKEKSNFRVWSDEQANKFKDERVALAEEWKGVNNEKAKMKKSIAEQVNKAIQEVTKNMTADPNR